ncbi:MAG: Signal recognition particle receptor protein FtsY (=alpha subunit) (TC 3.A.5.1.1), partial [uncultured Sulfurovum sp.]
MNKLLMMTLSVTILTFIGCSKNDNSQDEKTTEATNSTPEIAGVDMRIWYKDGVSFGTTRATDVMVNGGYPTYDIGTGLQNGFIVMNGAVNDLGGVDLGICNNAIKADNKLNDECTLPINKNEPKPSPEPEEDKEDTTPQPSPEPEEDKEDTTPQPSPEPEEDKED